MSDHYVSHTPFEQVKGYLIECGEVIDYPSEHAYYFSESLLEDFSYEITYTEYSTVLSSEISMRLDDNTQFSIDYSNGHVSGIFTFCRISIDSDIKTCSVYVCTTDGLGNDKSKAISDNLSINDLLNGNVSFDISVWDKGYTKDSYRAIAQNMLELTISYSNIWLSENLGLLVADLAD